MIAEVVFDTPVGRPFSYLIPDGWAVSRGQRVLAPLRGAARVGMVVTTSGAAHDRLKPLHGIVDGHPILSAGQLDLASWIASESLSSLGSTCAALLPPPMPRALDAAGSGHCDTRPGSDAATRGSSGQPRPELLIGPGRERRALARSAEAVGTVLVLTADVDNAARWAQRLAKIDRVGRLDSGVADAERAGAWAQLAEGSLRLAVGTRSALLAPLPSAATLILIDEHEAAHKPPGSPRIHARDVVLERATRDGVAAIFTAATPSVELWWRADSGRVALDAVAPTPWPAVAIADTRGILRREALTPPLARAIREALAAGQRVFLGVSRLTSALACDECGEVVRCEGCGIALAYSRAGGTLVCRLCGLGVPPLDVCRACRGRRLSPFGWGAERVEHAVRRRFPRARVARYDPDATRGARAEAQRAAAAAADVVIGTRGALRLFGPGSLGLAGFVSPDQLMRQPDFRAGERALGLMWAATERVRPDAQVVIQSQNPTHYALEALTRGDLRTFYRHELKFRAELGYPPFRRFATITVHERTAGESQRTAENVAAALRGCSQLTVYPSPPAGSKERARRLVVKGNADLARLLKDALADFETSRARGIIDVEVDPVEWRF